VSDFNVRELADAFYSSYLARDFFAKVVPGSLVLGSFLLWSEPYPVLIGVVEKLPVLGWLLVYGLCWGVGFAVQAIGERLGIVRSHPRDETEQVFRERAASFNASNPTTTDRSNRERFVVIKESTANLGVAIGLSIVLVGGCKLLPDYRKLIVAGFVVLCVAALLWFQAVHQSRERDWELRVIERSKTKEVDADKH